MEKQKNKLEACLARALSLVEGGAKSVVSDLGSEHDNLADLVSRGDEETRGHLAQLDELLKGLRKNLGALKNEITEARTMVSKLELPDSEEKGASIPSEIDGVDLSAKEAAEIRHDEPVTIGTILRSLLMANEPAQRERAEKERPS